MWKWALLFLLAGCATVPERPSLTAHGPEWLRASTGDVQLEGRHVVFISGFLNELIPGYFEDNAAVCRQLGAETSLIAPSSDGGFDRDVGLIERELAFRRGVPVVLFGHSKGGAAALLTVMRHPELVLSGQVEAVIVVQGAVGGSPLAEALRLLPLKGLKDLAPARARALFAEASSGLDARLTPEERARFFSHVFYVRSARDSRPVAAELSLTELALRGQGPNDGLLNQADMRLGEGVDLGVLDSDHASLTVSSFLSVSTPEERRAFTLALFREVARKNAHP